MNYRLKAALLCLLLAVLCGLAFVLSSCSRQERAMSTGDTVSALPIQGFRGDSIYAVVQSSVLPSIYDDFRSELSGRGLVNWDARFDCNKFASHYISLAQTKYAVAAWHSSSPAQSLALAEVWYHPTPTTAHAIVAAVTERGLLFVEPQTGREIQLTAAQRGSIYFTKW